MKIVSSGRALHSSEFHSKIQKKRRIQVIAIFVGVIILLVIPVILSRMERFLIKDIRVVGASVLGEDEVAQTVWTKLGGHYLWLIPRNNFLVFPRGKIVKDLPKEIPRIKTISLNLIGRELLEIKIEERIPAFLFCNNAIVDGVTADCYFLDKEGFIFAPAPSFSGDVYFIFSKDETGTNVLGKYLIPSEKFSALNDFLRNIEKLGLKSKSLAIGQDDLTKLTKYHAQLERSGRLTWNVDDSLEVISSNLEAFLLSPLVTEDKEFLDKILYIDLSVPNKVFYKFKN